MSEVKWIKITVDLFDDESIGLIEQMPEGDSLIVIWFKLLTKAGKLNDNGLVYFKEGIPYTEEMLSTVFRRPINVIRLALKTFQQFGMIEITDTQQILISNWEKHQNVSAMEQIKEYNRIAKRRQREKAKELKLLGCQGQCQGQVIDNHETDIDIDKEEDKDIELDNIDIDNSLSEDKSSEPIPEEAPKGLGLKEVKEFVELYNSIAVRLPKVQKISSSREKKIKARLKNLDLEGWKQVFEKCEKSDFCCGINSKNWSVSLDWLITNDNNYVKVLEGRYDNKSDKKVNENDKFSQLQRKGMEIL